MSIRMRHQLGVPEMVDNIYSHAVLTIIAASGESSRVGLGGLDLLGTMPSISTRWKSHKQVDTYGHLQYCNRFLQVLGEHSRMDLARAVVFTKDVHVYR